MNLRELKELFKLIEKTDFSEVEVSHGDLKVNVKRVWGKEVKTQPEIYREVAQLASEPPKIVTEPVLPKQKVEDRVDGEGDT